MDLLVGMAVHIGNPRYLGGRDWADRGLSPVQAKKSARPHFNQ
jgi:hypothetical protein